MGTEAGIEFEAERVRTTEPEVFRPAPGRWADQDLRLVNPAVREFGERLLLSVWRVRRWLLSGLPEGNSLESSL